MQQVTTKKFAEMAGTSEANIRGMLARGKLNAIKDYQGNNLFDIEDETNRKYLDGRRKNGSENQEAAQEINANVAQLNTQSSESVVIKLTEKITELAQEAGKAALLTDSIIEKEKDVKYWQEKYFELQQDNNELHEQLLTLTQEVGQLRLELEQAKNKPFWQFFKK